MDAGRIVELLVMGLGVGVLGGIVLIGDRVIRRQTGRDAPKGSQPADKDVT